MIRLLRCLICFVRGHNDKTYVNTAGYYVWICQRCGSRCTFDLPEIDA